MKVILSNTGKRFNREWVFRDLSATLNPGTSTAILGPNGSGKSTLLQVISGYLTPGAGTVNYEHQGVPVGAENMHSKISFAAPYVEPLLELTLSETIDFHFRFKKIKNGLKKEELIALAYLEGNENKQLMNFSSGMAQRLKLLITIMSDVPLLLLDEPCMNLDDKATAWYRKMMLEYTSGQTTVIASNQPSEYDFCQNTISLNDYKPRGRVR